MPFEMDSTISIHAPREGGDVIPKKPKRITKKFQSTPPARGATAGKLICIAPNQFQSTPPARGATASP